MKLFLFIFTITVALLSIAFSDTILARIGPLTDILNRKSNSNQTATTSSSNIQATSTSFEGLPVIPPTCNS